MAKAGAKAGATKPRALVTGGTGFVGSHLCERLLSEGYRVVCMDNLRTGTLENVAHLQNDPDFEYVEHDVTSYIHLPGELEEVYHFASPASPKDFERIPIPILKVGALGTYNALGLALARGARFMLASSSEVYGDPLVHPQTEHYRGNVNPIGVRGVYDEAKRYAESITFAYHRHHKVDTCIRRGVLAQPAGRVVEVVSRRGLGGTELRRCWRDRVGHEGSYQATQPSSKTVGVGSSAETASASSTIFCLPPLRNGVIGCLGYYQAQSVPCQMQESSAALQSIRRTGSPDALAELF